MKSTTLLARLLPVLLTLLMLPLPIFAQEAPQAPATRMYLPLITQGGAGPSAAADALAPAAPTPIILPTEAAPPDDGIAPSMPISEPLALTETLPLAVLPLEQLPLTDTLWMEPETLSEALTVPASEESSEEVTPELPPLPEDEVIASIVGGSVTAPGAWPWQVFVSGNGGDCGGALIDVNWVLTAAHCVGATPTNLWVTLGEHNRASNEGTEITRGVVRAIPHPWHSWPYHDIALLQLNRPVVLSTRVQVIPLVNAPAHNALVQPGKQVVATGWGSTGTSGAPHTILRQAWLPIIDSATCGATYGLGNMNDMLCAGRPGIANICAGDSGGPVVVYDGLQWRLAGISSGSTPNCLDYYSTATRVSSYVNWINSYLKQQDGVLLTAAHSGKCLEVPGGEGATGDGVRVVQRTCGGVTTSNQVWQLVPAGGNAYRVVALHSGKCLNLFGGATSDGAAVGQWSCAGGTNELWRLVPKGSNHQLISQLSGKCLVVQGGATGEGATVGQWSCVGAANELWHLNTGFAELPLRALNSNRCMSVSGASMNNGAAVVQWGCAGQRNQLWKLVPVGGGWVQVVAVHSGKCLTVSGAAPGNGVKSDQWTCLGANQTNQLWRVGNTKNGIQLIAKIAGKCVSVDGASLNNGALMRQWTCLGPNQTNQIWRLW